MGSEWASVRSLTQKGHTYMQSWTGASILAGWGSRPPDFGQVGREGCRGSWGSRTGHETLLYFIMYRKYVRKSWLLKRNRIIWSEVAVNAWKNRNFSEICLEKTKLLHKIAWKNQNFSETFWPGSTTPRFQTRLTPLVMNRTPLDLAKFYVRHQVNDAPFIIIVLSYIRL